MPNDTLLRVMVRPLSISMLESTLPVNVSHEPGDIALRLIGDLLQASENPLDAARARYRDASEGCDEPMCVPMHPTIMDHVVRPLIEAKQCYILGMPVACIAQAGLVGEMVALWRFRMLAGTAKIEGLDEDVQDAFKGDGFDRLGQERRVTVLKKIDSLDEATVQAFGELRSLRRRYLHFMIEQNPNADRDARNALTWANILVAKTLDVKFNEGRIVLPDSVRRFIHEMLQPASPASPQSEVSFD